MRLAASVLRCLAFTVACSSQLSAQMAEAYRGVTHFDSLIVEGKDREAVGALEFELGKANQLGYGTLLLLPYRAKLAVEVGALQEAVSSFKSPLASAADWAPWEGPERQRDRAALLLAVGDYKGAAEAAAEAYRLALKRGYHSVRIAYGESIEAEARLRLGDIAGAQQAMKTAIDILHKHRKLSPLFYVPRVFYTACLLKSYGASPGDAEDECKHGLALAESVSRERRDISLGYLTLAEARLRRSDLPGARQAASVGLDKTLKVLGGKHQDAARALQILAQTDLKEGNAAAARSHAETAIKVALAVFGDASPKLAELKLELAQCLDSPK